MFAAKMFAPRVLAVVVALSLASAFQSSARAALNTTDKDYMRQAMEEVLGEKEVGQIAREHARNAEVKHFAQSSVHSAETMEEELRKMATRFHHDLPGKDELARAFETRLTKMKKATDFDNEYVDGELDNLKHMVELFDKGAEKVDEGELKTWLGEKSKSLQDQRKELQDIKDKMKK